jgi:hypothetical protein
MTTTPTERPLEDNMAERTLPIRAFDWNHCKLGGVDQDLLEYLYSGAALS